MKTSIITINYNNSIGLEKTIQSVINQTFRNIEYIVIDGGSTDESVNVIKKHANNVAYWVSEKDKGIYDAMNKGIEVASGEYLLFLNSGDVLLNESIIEEVVNKIKGEAIVYCDLIWDNDGKKLLQKFPRKLNYSFFRTNSLGHQASLIKKNVFTEIGLYSTDYKIVSDWILYLKAICKHNLSYLYIDMAMSVCDRDGISCLPENWETVLIERKRFLNDEFKDFEIDYRLKDEKEASIRNSLFRRLLRKLKLI